MRNIVTNFSGVQISLLTMIFPWTFSNIRIIKYSMHQMLTMITYTGSPRSSGTNPKNWSGKHLEYP
ncbi:uncharacterized protein BO88DRAFT_233677 [Aspergillus vadensis CBS 113365]|uniref:Uncharacterized protein n=1 Tax=Aspergillus vadensis (strain CBS 113365 / IMI 142717 / IBT 24658) TaxID=1448311 RepID=A0A319BFY4_ASPVC|nr:hypothetical protein BO88DRAFT_233677 [Aspergillus vadensis CBS 113365]PYH71547.1 hypothetical protein BO88DRAFT_233677 [Aspergillus vadensis CBS 113365]